MDLVDGQYFLGEVSLLDLASKYGTPLYVYDGNKIVSQYERFKDSFDVADLRINYACKALTNISVLKLLESLGSGIDAVSPEEIKTALAAGFSPDRIIFTPNGVALSEIEEAMEMGVTINIDNIETLEIFGEKYPDHPIGIRINPHVMGGGNSKISVGHIDSKFGISIHQMPLVRRIVDALGMKISGVHMHTGSDILDVGVFLRAADILFQVALEFKDLSYIDFGSGFKVKYKPDDIETDINQFGREMSVRFREFVKNYGRELTLIFEPGKYLVSEAGYFLATTNVIKQTTSTVFAGLNTGLNHFIRPMFYDAYHRIINISNSEGPKRIYSVVGYICETDTFGFDRRINEIKPGDVLCFLNAGAYCFSMASNYNSRLLPAEVLVYNNQDHLIRVPQEFNQLLENQPNPNITF